MKTNISQFEKHIDKEIGKIWDNVNIHLYEDLDVRKKREFLSTYIPDEVIRSSKILRDTVINALMKEATDRLRDASVELQNRFYDYNIRDKIKEWTSQVENRFSPDTVTYSINPQIINGLIFSGITLITGGGITKMVFIKNAVKAGHSSISLGAIISGITTILLSAYMFKLAYDKSETKAISKMKDDIASYLDNAKKQLREYLNGVIRYFDEEFETFCKENGLEVK